MLSIVRGGQQCLRATSEARFAKRMGGKRVWPATQVHDRRIWRGRGLARPRVEATPRIAHVARAARHVREREARGESIPSLQAFAAG